MSMVDWRIEIDSAPEARSGMLWPDWTPKIHPQRELRMQSSIQPGTRHRLSRRCRNGATRGSRYGSSEEPNFGATRSAVNRLTVRDPRFRATWKLVDCRSQGKMSGVTRRSNQGEPDGVWSEVTRISISRCRRIRSLGQLGRRIVGDTEQAGARGNSRTGKSAPPKDARIGATR